MTTEPLVPRSFHPSACTVHLEGGGCNCSLDAYVAAVTLRARVDELNLTVDAWIADYQFPNGYKIQRLRDLDPRDA